MAEIGSTYLAATASALILQIDEISVYRR